MYETNPCISLSQHGSVGSRVCVGDTSVYQFESTWVSGWHGVCMRQIRVSVQHGSVSSRVFVGDTSVYQSGSAGVIGSVTVCLGHHGSLGL